MRANSYYDNGPTEEGQWFSLFCTSCTLRIVQHDGRPELFVLSRVWRACVWCACLPWALLARVPGRFFWFLVFSLTFLFKSLKVEKFEKVSQVSQLPEGPGEGFFLLHKTT